MIHFEIRYDKNGYPYWVLAGSNGEPVCWSESYSSLDMARKSIAWVKTNAPLAPLQQNS